MAGCQSTCSAARATLPSGRWVIAMPCAPAVRAASRARVLARVSPSCETATHTPGTGSSAALNAGRACTRAERRGSTAADSSAAIAFAACSEVPHPQTMTGRLCSSAAAIASAALEVPGGGLPAAPRSARAGRRSSPASPTAGLAATRGRRRCASRGYSWCSVRVTASPTRSMGSWGGHVRRRSRRSGQQFGQRSGNRLESPSAAWCSSSTGKYVPVDIMTAVARSASNVFSDPKLTERLRTPSHVRGSAVGAERARPAPRQLARGCAPADMPGHRGGRPGIELARRGEIPGCDRRAPENDRVRVRLAVRADGPPSELDRLNRRRRHGEGDR